MKRFALFFSVLVICSWTTVRAQFEGEIDMNITTNNGGKSKVMSYTMLVKGEMVASEVKGSGDEIPKGKFILRGDKKVMWIVNDEHKMYLEQSVEETAEKMKDMKTTEARQTDFKKSGKKETISGYDCEEWVDVGKDQTTSLWCTSKLGNVYQGLSKSFSKMGGMKSQSSNPAWVQEFKDKNLFPLKVVNTKNGQVTMTMEATKVEAKTLAASTFEPPEGYRKQEMNLDMNKMMQMMQEKMRQRQMEKKDSSQKNNN